MKKFQLPLTFILLFTLLLGCKKDQALINDISGDYKIEQIVSIDNGQETVAVPQNGIISFIKCQIRNKDSQNCDGYYQVGPGNRITFTYLPEKKANNEELFISIGDMSVDPYLGGAFEISERSSGSLVLTRYEFISGNRTYNLKLKLSKNN
ncbi:MAG TPA: hypothetical protein VGE26_00535 [Sphingobacteriaceae bacterium]